MLCQWVAPIVRHDAFTWTDSVSSVVASLSFSLSVTRIQLLVLMCRPRATSLCCPNKSPLWPSAIMCKSRQPLYTIQVHLPFDRHPWLKWSSGQHDGACKRSNPTSTTLYSSLNCANHSVKAVCVLLPLRTASKPHQPISTVRLSPFRAHVCDETVSTSTSSWCRNCGYGGSRLTAPSGTLW